MGSPITSGVFSAGRRTRSWANSPPSRLCSMPTLTFPISNKITQVPVGQGHERQQPVTWWVQGTPAKCPNAIPLPSRLV